MLRCLEMHKTTDFLDRSTWILASLLFLLILFSNITLISGNESSDSELLNNSDEVFIEEILEEPELNKVYKGKVVKIVEFGAFVNILPGKDGLVHISEISEERTENVEDVLKEGQEVDVKLIGFDRGKMKLSIKALADKKEESE